jgi:ABC-2 type transport system permease protein
MLKELDDVVFYKVYLEGEFPAGFKRLRNETKEMLDEFRAYAGDNIQYEFIDPNANPDKKLRNDLYKILYQKGLIPTTLSYKDEKDANTQKIIFPGCIISYKGRETSVQLLRSQSFAHPEAMINNSVKDLEYNLSNGIRKLKNTVKQVVAFSTGHGELEELAVADITKSLSEYYEVKRVKLSDKLNCLRGIKALIIAKPDSAFTEKEKFVLDQFIMHGGKVLWLVESTFATMDSLNKEGETVGISHSINLEDQLFKYGVRVNTHLIQDIQGAPIPIVTGMIGNQPQTQMFPWFYFPIIFPIDKHPIVKNLNAIRLEFANSIDTVGAQQIKKTILLRTSRFSRTINTPARIHLAMVKQEPQEKQFNKSFLPVSVLLEGKFESVFKNRLPPEIEQSKEIGYKQQCDTTNKMIIVADGDIIKNAYNKAKGTIWPLGYDRYTKEEYGNKDFILNCVNYLCDDEGLLSVRARELKLRLLDMKKVSKEKDKWKMINTVVPILLITLLGILKVYLRKQKYS